jgi:hypothetical protein
MEEKLYLFAFKKKNHPTAAAATTTATKAP